MYVAAAILVVGVNAEPGPRAPILNRGARQKVDLRSDEVIVKEILRTCPSSPAAGPREVKKVIRQYRKYGDERLGPRMAQAVANQRTGVLVHPRVTPIRLIDGQIHLPAGLQHARVLGECRRGIVRMMNDSVGNHDVHGAVRKRQAEVVAYDTGNVITFPDQAHRDPAAVHPDRADSSLGQETQHAAWTTPDVKDERIWIKTFDHFDEGRRHKLGYIRRFA